MSTHQIIFTIDDDDTYLSITFSDGRVCEYNMSDIDQFYGKMPQDIIEWLSRIGYDV